MAVTQDAPASAEVKTYELFIDGEWRPAKSGETFETVNPATEEVIANVAKAGPEDVEAAVEAARRAFESGPWRTMTPDQRSEILARAGDLLFERAQDLAALEARDSGATIRRTSIIDGPGVAMAAHGMAERVKHFPFTEVLPMNNVPAPGYDYIVREPVGVVAGVIPWNFPLFFAANKTLPSIAVGNSIVLKPASYTPLTALEFTAILHEAGVPPGVVNCVTGPGAAAGETLVAHPDVDKVTFTGSTEVGRRIMSMAAGTLKNVTLECGGKSPNILLDDADLDIAIDGSLFAIFNHSGQICIAGSRLLVHRSIYDEVLDRLVARTEQITLGDTMDFSTDIGPLVAPSQIQTVEEYVEIGKAEGARLVTGGSRPDNLDRGYFFSPTIFADVDNGSRLAQEEVFGPVLAVIPFESDAEAIGIANDTIYGLAGGVWSRNLPRAMEVAAGVRHGTIWINDYLMVHPDAPYAGFKQSGVGLEGGTYGMAELTTVKHVHVSLTNTRQQKFWLDVAIPQK